VRPATVRLAAEVARAAGSFVAVEVYFVAVEVNDAQSSVALTSRHSEEIASCREAIQTTSAVEIQNSAAAIEIRLSCGRSVMVVPGFDPHPLCADLPSRFGNPFDGISLNHRSTLNYCWDNLSSEVIRLKRISYANGGFGVMQAGIYSCHVGMLFACLISGAVLCAQQPMSIQSENGVYTLHADTHLGLLDVVVTDKHGHPVAGLTKGDFKLLEDGQPQTIKFFEEHAPADPAEIARQRAAAKAALPPNTFTNYEPFTGRPVTVLLLNQLFPLRGYDLDPLHQRMLDTVQNAPPGTPFAI